ncbi:unnamed protein product [Clavelina lepadiformis]|uniref:XK-related protein n=1 Tax=Clavelina lepadiformis TaxID=159417 RepID=A0ABP0FUW5_CLALP
MLVGSSVDSLDSSDSSSSDHNDESEQEVMTRGVASSFPFNVTVTDSAITLPEIPSTPDCPNIEPKSKDASEQEGCQEEVAFTFCSTFHALFNFNNFWKPSHYTIISLCLNIVPIIIYLFDFVTDWLNGFSYLKRRQEYEDNIIYFGMTIALIIFPTIIIHVFSAYWEIKAKNHERNEGEQENGTNNGCCFLFGMALVHILQIGPVYRYLRAAHHGLKSTNCEIKGNKVLRDYYYKKCHVELAAVGFLRMVESFLEAGPQLILQIYIMVTTLQTPFITVFSCCMSLFGMSTCPVSFERDLRISDDKEQLSIIGTVVMFLYRVCNITSRVFALALLLNLHFWIWISLFLLHWCAMTLMIVKQNTEFCGKRSETTLNAKEIFYDVIIGFFYNFDYFNVQTGNKNKWKMLFYYVVVFIEDLAIVTSWYFFRHGGSLLDYITGATGNTTSKEQVNFTTISTPVLSHGVVPDHIALMLVLVTMATYFFGVGFLTVYYTVCHTTTASRYSIKTVFHWKRFTQGPNDDQGSQEEPASSTVESPI